MQRLLNRSASEKGLPALCNVLISRGEKIRLIIPKYNGWSTP